MLNHKMQMEALHLLSIKRTFRAKVLLRMGEVCTTLYPQTERLLDAVRKMYPQEEE